MGTGQQKRAECWEFNLNFRMSLLQAVMDVPLDMPRRDSDTSSSGDEQKEAKKKELKSSD